MTLRQKRMVTVVAILAGVGVATAFALQAFQKNLLYYYSPTQILAGEAPDARSFRVGGLVETGSVKRARAASRCASSSPTLPTPWA